MTAAHTASMVAANAASLFTHSGGIQAIAGNGPVSLQAHTDGLEILADKEITVISVNDCIEIKAKQKIVLQAGQSAITLEGGDITFACPGKFSVKGSKHLFDKGVSRNSAIEALPDTRVKTFAQQVRAIHEPTGEAIAQMPYRLETGDGDVHYGYTDDDGKTIQVRTISEQGVKVWWGVLPPGQTENA
jgi:type VI secretion system secreted protein VgrG